MNTPKKTEFLDAVQKLAESVYDFHHRWNLIKKSKSPFESIIERKNLLQEEIDELNQECLKLTSERSPKLLSEEAADVLYVAIGHLFVLNNTGILAANAVSEKNNNKTTKTHYLDSTTNKVTRKKN
ncbi:MAG: hypothetical protein VX868_03740 [Chloroflexota bacterium]|jgi:NTP pyrophosphatase (non-canonical NTP hydrolase)|nr:hypothetical protein [Chloroflexota bacterium]|tara:strand:+ start:19596 stop:19973 length:378 start_codon:yes stop_codon:yes gene_type:complete